MIRLFHDCQKGKQPDLPATDWQLASVQAYTAIIKHKF